MRTNNNAEGFYSRFNRRVLVSHPNIWSFIKFLQGEESRFNHMRIQFGAGLGARAKPAKTIAIQHRMDNLAERYYDGLMDPMEYLHGDQLLRYNVIKHNILSSKATNSELTFEDMSRSFQVSATELRSVATRMIRKGILNAESESDTLYYSQGDSDYVTAQEIYVKMSNPSYSHRSSCSTTNFFKSSDSSRHRFRR